MQIEGVGVGGKVQPDGFELNIYFFHSYDKLVSFLGF